MTLENIFYLSGIICAVLFFLLFLFLVITLWSIQRDLSRLGILIRGKVELLKDIISHPKVAALQISGKLAQRGLTKLTNMFQPKEAPPRSSSFFSLLKDAGKGWKDDNAGVWCAALAYYTVFSLGPLLLIVISVAGLFLSNADFEKNVYGQLQGLLGSQGASLLHTLAEHSQKNSSNIIGTIVGVITLLLGASGMFGQLQQMLNAIWGVTQKPHVGIIALIRSRLLNMSMIGVIVFLLLVSLLASTAITTLGTFFGYLLPASSLILFLVNILVSFLLITILFAFILKVLPDVQLRWRNVWTGAFVSSLLFTIGKEVISLYIGHSGVSSQYGAAGSLIVLLLWVFYTTQILFFGVEFTKAVTLRNEGGITPSKFAVLEEDK